MPETLTPVARAEEELLPSCRALRLERNSRTTNDGSVSSPSTFYLPSTNFLLTPPPPRWKCEINPNGFRRRDDISGRNCGQRREKMNEDESEEGGEAGVGQERRKTRRWEGERERETEGPIYCVFSSPSQNEMCTVMTH